MKKLSTLLLIFVSLFSFAQQDEYYRKVDWKFYPESVIQLTDSTYQTDAIPYDYNDPGSINRIVGNYVVDFVGHRYSVIDSTSATITVLDVYHTGQAPQTGQIARCYRSVYNGDSKYVGSVDYSPLDESARWKMNGSDNEILWRHGVDYEFPFKRLVLDTVYVSNGLEKTGTTYWDEDNKTFSDVLGNGVIGQRYEEQFISGQNNTGSEILNGKVATYASTIGNSGNIRIELTVASASEPSFMTIGIVTESIYDGESGKITTYGKVRGIQTNGANYGETWVNQDILYKSSTVAGGLTKVPPEAPIPAIPIAVVISAHATNGTLLVRPTYPTSMQSLTDVNGTELTVSGQIPVWNQINQYFDFDKNINDYWNKQEITDADTARWGLGGGTPLIYKNGLRLDGDSVKLGGTLTEDTEIQMNNKNLDFAGTGDNHRIRASFTSADNSKFMDFKIFPSEFSVNLSSAFSTKNIEFQVFPELILQRSDTASYGGGGFSEKRQYASKMSSVVNSYFNGTDEIQDTTKFITKFKGVGEAYLNNAIIKDKSGIRYSNIPEVGFTDTTLVTKYYVDNLVTISDSLKEDKANKVTTLSSGSTDVQYPSAKVVWEALSTKGAGTVTSVTAGNGLTQSGTSTINPTIDVVSHAGSLGAIGTITVTANSVGVDLGETSTKAYRGDRGATAYTDRLKWDGGSTELTASTGRTSLGLGNSATLNLGSTTGTVLEGRTFGTAANSATTDFLASSINPYNSSVTFNGTNNILSVTDAGGAKSDTITPNVDLLINGFSGTINVTTNPVTFNWPVAYTNTNYYLDIFPHYTETIGGKSVMIRNAVYDFTKSTSGFSLKLDTLAGVVEYRASRTINSETPANVLLQSDLTTTVGSPGLDTKIPTEKAVRTAIAGFSSMVYPSSGIALSTGSAWGTSITNNSANWNTAYTDRLKWDGGSTGLTASTGRTSLGGTTIGQNLFTLTNPSALTFPRFNADNSISSLNASDFKTAIGGGTTTASQIIKFDTGVTEGTDLYTFNGSSAKTIDIKAGTNITLTKASGSITITASGGSATSYYGLPYLIGTASTTFSNTSTDVCQSTNNTFINVVETGVIRYIKWNGTSWITQQSTSTGVTFAQHSITSLTSTSIAIANWNDGSLTCYSFNGSTWTQTGSSLSISGMGRPNISALSTTTIAYIDAANYKLRTYSFNGSTWSQVGSEFSLSTFTHGRICAMSSTTIAYVDYTNHILTTYSFNGSTWSQVGSGLNITVANVPDITSLAENVIAYIDEGTRDLYLYKFDGSNWIECSPHINIASITSIRITAVNGSDIVLHDSTIDTFRAYHFPLVTVNPYKPF